MGRRREDPRKDEIEDLHGEIRRLRKLVQVQKREIARLRKFENKYSNFKEDPDDETPSSEPKPPRKPACKECTSSHTEVMDIGIRKYLICKECGSRARMDA